MSDVKIRAGNVRKTTTGAASSRGPGVDLDVAVSFDGRVVLGAATLLPNEDGRPGYDTWGHVEHWLSGGLVVELVKAFGAGDHLGKVLKEVALACRVAAR